VSKKGGMLENLEGSCKKKCMMIKSFKIVKAGRKNKGMISW
jgi:hypothetical protein